MRSTTIVIHYFSWHAGRMPKFLGFIRYSWCVGRTFYSRSWHKDSVSYEVSHRPRPSKLQRSLRIRTVRRYGPLQYNLSNCRSTHKGRWKCCYSVQYNGFGAASAPVNARSSVVFLTDYLAVSPGQREYNSGHDTAGFSILCAIYFIHFVMRGVQN